MDKLHLKKAFKQNIIGRRLVSIKDELLNSYLYHRRKKLIPQLSELLGGGNVTIISSNCFAGRIMQDLKMEYNSPTLGLYIWSPDYIELLRNLKYYMTVAKIEFVEHSKYQLGNERRAKRSITHHWYPVGLLDGKVEIQFLHYHSEEEAAEKWYRRAARINWDKLLVIGMEQNLCTEDDIRDFDALPFDNKIIFTTHDFKDLDSNCFIKEFYRMESVPDPYRKADIYYRYLINRFNGKI